MRILYTLLVTIISTIIVGLALFQIPIDIPSICIFAFIFFISFYFISITKNKYWNIALKVFLSVALGLWSGFIFGYLDFVFGIITKK
jgi:hypothetical protein